MGHVKNDVNEFALESINEKTSTRAHASLESINEDYGGLSRDDAEAAREPQPVNAGDTA
ncbi:MAG: hypothetical protein H0V78_05695 [Burkholderiales bacterium]|nr:hypothetical protein [Burkholderiales bacterium]